MSCFKTAIHRLLGAVLFFLALSSVAFAACSDLTTITEDQLGETRVQDLQKGLRAAYRDPNPLLADNRLGVYTRTRLTNLCEDVPRPDGLDDISSTLALTAEYADIEDAWPNWARDLYSTDLKSMENNKEKQALAIRLASTTPMKSIAIGRRALTYDCADPLGALADSPAGTRTFATLQRFFGDASETALCQRFPVAGGATEFKSAMERLGQINDRRMGALQILQNTAFLDWIAAGETENRLRRLAGTVSAVLALIDEYQNRSGPGGQRYVGGPCSPRKIERTHVHYALDTEDIDSFDFLISLTPELEAFRADQGGFDSPQALWRALRPVLADHLEDCILSEIGELVVGPDRLPLAYFLKPAATDALMADASLVTAQPLLAELAPLRTATKAELMARIKAGLQDIQQNLVGEDVTAAADTLAAASEPTTLPTDTALIEFDEDEEDIADPTPMITATDATDIAVETAIDNPELANALRNTPLADATVPELMRSQVRSALQETAAKQAARTVEQQIVLIEPAVTSEWTLTEALIGEITALPYVRAAMADATGDAAAVRLAPLTGISYPSYRLFEKALETVSSETSTETVPFSTFVTERIIQTAQRNETSNDEPRVYGPIEIEGCNCVPLRQEDENDLIVYGFYPYWLAPLRGQEDKTHQRVDFGTIDQIAFYGLEFTSGKGDTVTLHNERQWQDARRHFINSAHKFRAKADLAFDLRDWMQWDDQNIDSVVAEIAKQMAPFNRLESYRWDHIGDAIPTLFDPVQPDGLTLIFHGYEGIGLSKDHKNTMIRIIKSVYEQLPNRDKLGLNVAFDFAINGDDFQKPIFDDLYDLLQPTPYVLADEDTEAEGFNPDSLDREVKKVIDKILLFLERPTTKAKKGLRFRMEQGLFQGEPRRRVLRSIIPVVPPSGHAAVLATVKPNDPDQSERPAFSQFDDDIVYFKDNFSGVGFWPVPDPNGTETPRINQIIAENFNTPRLPPLLASFEAPAARVCNFACPNRAGIALAAMALFVFLALLTWRSFYSGFVDQFAFRFMAIGAVWIGNIILVLTLLLLAQCDPHSVWPNRILWLLVAVLAFLSAYNFYQRIKNGPMP